MVVQVKVLLCLESSGRLQGGVWDAPAWTASPFFGKVPFLGGGCGPWQAAITSLYLWVGE